MSLSRAAWLEQVPRLLRDAADRWELHLNQERWSGRHAEVVSASQNGRNVALKLKWLAADRTCEHLALRTYAASGAVQLIAAQPRDAALLLERLDGNSSLESVHILQACEVLGTLLRATDRPPLAQAPRLSELIPRWIDLCSQGSARVPHRLSIQASALLNELSGNPPADRLVNANAHFTNVLRAQRAPWLLVSPEPVTGDPAYALAPALWAMPQVAADAFNLRTHLRLRLQLVAEAASIDEERARAWAFVRVLLRALQQARDDQCPQGELTRSISIAKAVSD